MNEGGFMLSTFPKAQEVVTHVEKLLQSCETYEQKKQCVSYAQNYRKKYYKTKALKEAECIENYINIWRKSF